MKQRVAKEPLEKQPQTHLFDFVKKIPHGCSMAYLSAAFASVDKWFSITNSLINKWGYGRSLAKDLNAMLLFEKLYCCTVQEWGVNTARKSRRQIVSIRNNWFFLLNETNKESNKKCLHAPQTTQEQPSRQFTHRLTEIDLFPSLSCSYRFVSQWICRISFPSRATNMWIIAVILWLSLPERWESVFAIHSILYFTFDYMFRFKKTHLKISRGKAG